jgi:hypothetical protein
MLFAIRKASAPPEAFSLKQRPIVICLTEVNTWMIPIALMSSNKINPYEKII